MVSKNKGKEDLEGEVTIKKMKVKE